MLHYVTVPFHRQKIGKAEQHGGDQAYRCAHFYWWRTSRRQGGHFFKIMVRCLNLKRCQCDVGGGGGGGGVEYP